MDRSGTDEPSLSVPPTVVAISDRSVMAVSGEACGSLSSGGGVAVAPDIVLTNAHVVAGVTDVSVSEAGSETALEGAVIGFDADRDLALVEVGGGDLSPVSLHDGDPPSELRLVTVDGSGRIHERTAILNRVIVATGDDIYRRSGARRSALELGVSVVSGESGSGVFTDGGELAGVVFANSGSADARSYAVASSEVAAFLDRSAESATPAGPCLSAPPPEPGGD
jgi:hypothetical protein